MAFDSSPLRVEVVSAEGVVWEGEAQSVVARTTEGDIGILANHEPLMAILVPSAAEVLAVGGTREIIAVDGGFLSVANNRVSLISSYARMAAEISGAEADAELARVQSQVESGDVSDETMQRLHRASAQVRAAAKAGRGN